MAEALFFLTGWLSASALATIVIWRLWIYRSRQMTQVQRDLRALRAEMTELETGIATAVGHHPLLAEVPQRGRLRLVRDTHIAVAGALGGLPEVLRKLGGKVRDNPALTAVSVYTVAAAVGSLAISGVLPDPRPEPPAALPQLPRATSPAQDPSTTPETRTPRNAATTHAPASIPRQRQPKPASGERDPLPPPELTPEAVPPTRDALPIPDVDDLIPTPAPSAEPQPSKPPLLQLRIEAAAGLSPPDSHRRIFATTVKGGFAVTM